MSHRTQITLEDDQYARLQRESRETGLGLAELVRRALDQVYGASSTEQFERSLARSFGAWSEREGSGDLDGAEFVEELRQGRSDRFRGV